MQGTEHFAAVGCRGEKEGGLDIVSGHIYKLLFLLGKRKTMLLSPLPTGEGSMGPGLAGL